MAGLLAFAVHASGQKKDLLVQHQYEGNLGESRVGMTVIRKATKSMAATIFIRRFSRTFQSPDQPKPLKLP